MPMDRGLYPKNWKEIARRIKQAANWHCQACDRPCLLPGENWLDFMMRLNWTVGEALSALSDNGQTNPEKVVRFVLTTAHPNHDPENPAAELRAWCTTCHCRYDLRQIATKRRLKREREGQINLLDLTVPQLTGHSKHPQQNFNSPSPGEALDGCDS